MHSCSHKIIALFLLGSVAGCTGGQSDQRTTAKTSETAMSPFASDRHFLQQYHPDLVELRADSAGVLICPTYQGRVMTSTADGQASYGWINYDLIRSRKIGPHMNAFGGEDRFWLGPEGGQFALFFKPGDPFDGEHWQTPPSLDSEPFELVGKTESSATFGRDVELTNYAGTRLSLRIERTISLLTQEEIGKLLGEKTEDLTVVGVQSVNTISNRGTQAWTSETGMPSVWILGMMNASPQTTVIVPYRSGVESPSVDSPINDTYFGKVPADRLLLTETAGLFRADARYRSKIGVAPDRATPWLGSYDPVAKTLTLVTYSFDPAHRQYVNSAWEHQREPYAGDVINAYNDGPMKPGQPQMGNFYELESSSPAANLAPGGQLIHRHTTLHVQGPEPLLNAIVTRLLRIDLNTVQTKMALK